MSKILVPARIFKSKTSRFWLAEIPSLELVTQGYTHKDACEMLKDAVETIADGKFEVSVYDGVGETVYVGSDRPSAFTAFFLKSFRTSKKLTVRQVAERMGSRSPNAYAQYESGKVQPSAEKLIRILKAMEPEGSMILDFKKVG